MMNNYWGSFSGQWAMPLGMNGFAGVGALILFLIVAWSIYWKGMALWKAARRGEKAWFVALLVINTLGILEILYIYVFSEKSKPVGENKQ